MLLFLGKGEKPAVFEYLVTAHFHRLSMADSAAPWQNSVVYILAGSGCGVVCVRELLQAPLLKGARKKNLECYEMFYSKYRGPNVQ